MTDNRWNSRNPVDSCPIKCYSIGLRSLAHVLRERGLGLVVAQRRGLNSTVRRWLDSGELRVIRTYGRGSEWLRR